MIRKLIISMCLIGSLFIILETNNFFSNLFYLVMGGFIPGTNIDVSPLTMMIVCIVLGLLVLVIFIGAELHRYITINRMARAIMSHKKKLPKHRYHHA